VCTNRHSPQKKHEQIIEEEEPLECVLNQTFKKPKTEMPKMEDIANETYVL